MTLASLRRSVSERSDFKGFVGLLALAVLGAHPSAAAASIDGEYSVGPQSVKVSIKSWGDDCGPKPKSYTSKGKGTVTVTQKGDHLFFSNGRSTKKCWSANPKLQRLSVTKKGNIWTIICESPSSDSRYEHGTYVVNATTGKITVKDRSKYNWKLKESVCEATIVIQRSFSKLGGGEEPDEEPEEIPEVPDGPPVKIPTIEKEYPEPPQPAKCKNPGPPVKFILLPSSAKTTPGRKVCFTAYEVDKDGCRTSVGAEFKLVKEKSGRRGRMDGHCFIPGDSAADSEGKFKVVATHGYDTATSRVTVLSAFIEDLIAVNLDPVGDQDEEAGSPQVPSARSTDSEEIDVPVAGQKRPPVYLLYILPPGFVVILLVIVVVVAVRQRKKKLHARIEELMEQRMAEEAREGAPPSGPVSTAPPHSSAAAPQPARQRRQAHIPRTEEPSAAPAAVNEADSGVTMVCRVCGREFHGGSKFCPHDGSALVSESDQDEPVKESGMICPRCGRGYSAGTRNCGEDGELLVPASVADAGLDRSGVNPPRQQKKICPVCSQVYTDDSMFCGKDGVKLVPMN